MPQTEIPIIDLRNLPDGHEVMRLLDHACKEWGFFQIVGHGIDQALRQDTLREMARFFSLPSAEKRSIIRTSDNAWGFFDRELTKNVLDWKEIFDVGPSETRGPLAGAVPQWPESLPEFKTTLRAYTDACERIARHLLSSIAMILGAAPADLNRAFEPEHSSFLRLNYYPLCAEPATPESPTVPEKGHLGISHHTDAGALTVLMQSSVAGLQVKRRGRWYLVEPQDDALVINIGDIVQVWSNDRYKAPLHRVVANSHLERYSAAFFFNPSYEANYAPLPSVCDENNPPLYEPINWGEFRAGRAADDYADVGEEIQISHFRTSSS